MPHIFYEVPKLNLSFLALVWQFMPLMIHLTLDIDSSS